MVEKDELDFDVELGSSDAAQVVDSIEGGKAGSVAQEEASANAQLKGRAITYPKFL